MEKNAVNDHEAGNAFLKVVGGLTACAVAGATASWFFLGRTVDQPTEAARTAFDEPAEGPLPTTYDSTATTEPLVEEEEPSTTTTTAKATTTTTASTTTTTKPPTTTSTVPVTTIPATTSTTERVPSRGELAYTKAADLYLRVKEGVRHVSTVDACRTLQVSVTGTNPGNYELKEAVLFDVGSGPAVLGGWIDDDEAPNHGQPVIIGHNATITGDTRDEANRQHCGPQSMILFYDADNTRIEGVIPEGPDQPAEKVPVGVAKKTG